MLHFSTRSTFLGCVAILAVISFSIPGLSEGRMPETSRASAPRDIDTHHLFTPPTDKKAWASRAKALREQILFSSGLLPMPEKTPLNPRVTGKIVGPDYTIENVALETMPGFYLCGNLYRPKTGGKHPGIANPHGHWNNGRLEIQPDVERTTKDGKMGVGRGNLVSIGVNLARQGHVVFAYDMVGYNDTNQVDHKFAGNLRPWIWNVSLLGLQLWNSIRVVDYLTSLPDVDANRIGVTGASGGGTQTFLLSAVDDRIKASVPVNMISSYMQGGCLCENGPGLRVDTDNPEIGACFAPKPQMLVAATGDWTNKVPNEEWPAIRKVYDLYGAGDKTAVNQFNYQHNYNIDSREAMYAWFGTWLLGRKETSGLKERPFEVDVKAMRVWNDRNPMPPNALKEPELIQSMIDQSEKQLADLWPKSAGDLPQFRAAYGPALRISLGVAGTSAERAVRGGSAKRQALLVVYDKSGEKPSSEIAAGARGPAAALGLDLAEMKADALWSKFYSCYNRTPLCEAVERVILEADKLRQAGNGRVDIVAYGKAGIPALLARGLSQTPGRTVIDAGQFDNSSDDAFITQFFAPGLRRAGDVRTAAMLSAQPLCIFNTGSRFDTRSISKGYEAIGVPFLENNGVMDSKAIGKWLNGK